MSAVEANVQSAQYVDFWNEILVPKFIKYKHILVDGLTHHSEAIFPSLPVKEGDRVLDIGCGFGDTAIKLARRVGKNGKVVGLDCCEAFLEYGRKTPQIWVCRMFRSSTVMRCSTTSSPSMISSFRASERCFSPIRWQD